MHGAIIIGLTGNLGALRRWMVAEPEIARITAEFEEQEAIQRTGDTAPHHHDHAATWGASIIPERGKGTCGSTERDGDPFLEHMQSQPTIASVAWFSWEKRLSMSPSRV